MPFTVSHAVVALAARRTPLPVAAVAVGAMAPDAVLFAPFLPPYVVAHSWVGVVTIDLVVALVVLVAWCYLVRSAWSGAVPVVRERLPASWSAPPRGGGRPVRRAVAVVVACLVGSATHVLWDAFSHEAGWAVQAIPFLREGPSAYPVWAGVQDGSSVLGLLGLVVAAAVWWRRSTPRRVPPTARWDQAVVAAAGVVVVLAALGIAGRVLLDGGGVAGIVTALAFRLPVVVALVLVVGAVGLLAGHRTRSP
ncbi:DUF4184 family protein [Curtobacterium sp. A7_M15]|uniref:DUF4184 family protein n=1 Tax=Curtobacterium sp. A7_M15 TaxID=3065241 RepID=UPI0027379E90|nr:DUF4184 family protein [Curtobacterium sp. A7_M15]MDP4331760.1 DUF4184 family protein [Curtobacterium sp. A7_M15]